MVNNGTKIQIQDKEPKLQQAEIKSKQAITPLVFIEN